PDPAQARCAGRARPRGGPGRGRREPAPEGSAMTEILRTISSLAIVAFAASSMLAAGFSFTLREIIAPLREPSRVARALLGNFVLVPLLAIGVARAFSLDA